jgi:hypothetical protein
VGNVDGNIANDLNLPLFGVGLQGRPLAVKLELKKLVAKNIAG